MSSLIDWLVQNEPAFRKSRLPSLYSDLTVQKTTNPDGYAANVAAWQSALTRAALAGQLPTETRLVLHTADKLLNGLTSPSYGRPSGLGAVIDDGVRSGKMIDLREFQSAEKSIYSRSWVPSPWSILQWSLRQIGLSGGKSYDVSGKLRVGSLVLVQALEDVSKEVLAMQAKKGQCLTDRIVSRETFVKDLALLGAGTLSDEDLEVLLCYLHRDKQALSFDLKTIKFKPPAATIPESITSQDTAIANLKLLITNLTSQVGLLESRITNLQFTAQTAVKVGNKHTALSSLRSKKLAEKTLQQRTATLSQLEEVFTSIESAASQVEIMQAMEASASVLKGLNKQVGGVERVEDVVDQLREEMVTVDEVGQVISEPLDQKAVLDEEEVDEELAAMEAEQRKETEERGAEKTRERLRELERVDRQKEQNVEEQVEVSTKRLSKMSIDNLGTPSEAARQQKAAVEHA